jgi:hypothetical protein
MEWARDNQVNFDSLFISKQSMLDLLEGAVLKKNTNNKNKIKRCEF